MNKTDYLNSLRGALSGLPQSEVEEIVRDQEEHIIEAMRSGRSETEVVGALGSPSDFAKEIKAGQQIRAAVSETKLISKTDKVFRAIFALCVLAPFNVIVVLGPFLAVCGILLGLWISTFGVAVAGVAVFGLSFLAIPINFALFVGALFGAVSGIGFSVLILVGCYTATLWFLKATLWYLNKNLEFVTGEVRS